MKIGGEFITFLTIYRVYLSIYNIHSTLSGLQFETHSLLSSVAYAKHSAHV